MYLLEVEVSFEAAHRLPEYDGPCRRIHGHHWVVRAQYKIGKLDNQGMAIDLTILKKQLRQTVSPFDHQSLNTAMTCTPTSENIARVIFGQLQQRDGAKSLSWVSVEETPGSKVTYSEES